MDFAAFVGLLSRARSAAFNGLSLRNPRDPGTLSEGMVFPHFGYIKEFAHHLLREWIHRVARTNEPTNLFGSNQSTHCCEADLKKTTPPGRISAIPCRRYSHRLIGLLFLENLHENESTIQQLKLMSCSGIIVTSS